MVWLWAFNCSVKKFATRLSTGKCYLVAILFMWALVQQEHSDYEDVHHMNILYKRWSHVAYN